MLFLIVFIFYELIFALYTGNSIGPDNAGFILLFSIFFGGMAAILSSVSKNRIFNIIIRFLVLIICPVLYMIPFFVFCEFGMMYDLNTVLLGAGDAVSGFSGDIRTLVFSVRGISFILLMLLPCTLYGLYTGLYKKIKEKYLDKFLSILINKENEDIKNRIIDGMDHVRFSRRQVAGVLIASVICYLMSITGICLDEENRDLYGKEYNYEKAVRTFGQATAYRLEIKRNIFGRDDDISFSSQDAVDLNEYSKRNVSSNDISKKTAGVSGNSVSQNSVSENTVSNNSVSDNKIGENAVSSNKMTTYQEDLSSEKKKLYSDGERNILNIDFEYLAENGSKKEKELDEYVAGLPGSSKNDFTGLFKGKNLIFITAEAFTAEVIDEERTPTLYRMATKGINFTDYYQFASAGTTGGEYANIMGMLPSNGGASMKNTAKHLNYMTLGYQLNELGYYGKAYHNNSYTFYDRHLTHNNLGYSEGYVGYGNGIEEYVSNKWPESDLEMMEGSFKEYIDHQPFNIYYMSVSGHSLYDFNRNAMATLHKDAVKDLPYSSRVRGYLAGQMEFEAALTYLVEQLEEAGIADDTVICIGADHYPYGLDSDGSKGTLGYLSELYGKKITNNFVRDHNRLIIWSGCLEKEEPVIVDDPVSSIDILPTLLNLFGVDYDSRLLPGRDVFSDSMPLVYDLGYNWKTDKGTFVGGKFRPVSDDVEIPEGYVKTVKSVVSDKIKYSKGVLNLDYYRHVFGDKEE